MAERLPGKIFLKTKKKICQAAPDFFRQVSLYSERFALFWCLSG
jgi:hypothetical protein